MWANTISKSTIEITLNFDFEQVFDQYRASIFANKQLGILMDLARPKPFNLLMPGGNKKVIYT